MSLDFTDGQSLLVQVMAWYHQATSHYLRQCWLRSLSPYGVIRPQWVKATYIFCWAAIEVPCSNNLYNIIWQYLGDQFMLTKHSEQVLKTISPKTVCRKLLQSMYLVWYIPRTLHFTWWNTSFETCGNCNSLLSPLYEQTYCKSITDALIILSLYFSSSQNHRFW